MNLWYDKTKGAVELKAFKRWRNIVGVIWGLFSVRALWIMYIYRNAFSNMASIEDRFEFWSAVIVWCVLTIIFISLCVTKAALLEAKQEKDELYLKLYRHIRNSDMNGKD